MFVKLVKYVKFEKRVRAHVDIKMNEPDVENGESRLLSILYRFINHNRSCKVYFTGL